MCRSLSLDQKQKNSLIDDNTNAQENVGKQVQESYGKGKKCPIGDCLLHIYIHISIYGYKEQTCCQS